VLVAVSSACCRPSRTAGLDPRLDRRARGRRQTFEILLVSLGGEPPPDEINVRLKGDIDDGSCACRRPGRRAARSALMRPPCRRFIGTSGDRPGRQASSVLVLRVAPKADAVRS